jgi:hypothetical protein
MDSRKKRNCRNWKFDSALQTANALTVDGFDQRRNADAGDALEQHSMFPQGPESGQRLVA